MTMSSLCNGPLFRYNVGGRQQHAPCQHTLWCPWVTDWLVQRLLYLFCPLIHSLGCGFCFKLMCALCQCPWFSNVMVLDSPTSILVQPAVWWLHWPSICCLRQITSWHASLQGDMLCRCQWELQPQAYLVMLFNPCNNMLSWCLIACAQFPVALYAASLFVFLLESVAAAATTKARTAAVVASVWVRWGCSGYGWRLSRNEERSVAGFGVGSVLLTGVDRAWPPPYFTRR